MSNEENPFDIFDVSADDVKDTKKGQQSNELYKPNPKQGQDNVYTATVRFLPDIENPKKPYIKKFTYWLEDAQGQGQYFDSPATIGEKCPIAETYFSLSKSNDAYDQKAAEQLKRRTYFYSMVQIVKDKQKPDLEGQVLVWRFPIAIKKLIDNQLEPTKEEREQGIEPCNVFDPMGGKDFFIKMTVKGGFWNYDECKFIDQKKPMRVVNDKGDLVNPSEGEDGKNEIINYLKENRIDLSKFDFKPWSDQQKKKVYEILSMVTGKNMSEQDIGSTVENTTSTEESEGSTVENTTSTEESESTTGDDFLSETDSGSDSTESNEVSSDENTDDDLETFINNEL